MNKINYELLDAIYDLKKKGYTVDFNYRYSGMLLHPKGGALSPEDFSLDLEYRFLIESQPEEHSELYAISSKRYSIKGLLFIGYGMIIDNEINAFISKLISQKQKLQGAAN